MLVKLKGLVKLWLWIMIQVLVFPNICACEEGLFLVITFFFLLKHRLKLARET